MVKNMTPAELIIALTRGKGEDKTLDAHLWIALHDYTLHEDTDPSKGSFSFWYGEPWKSTCSNCSSWKSLTGSIDNALDVARKVSGDKEAAKMLVFAAQNAYPDNIENIPRAILLTAVMDKFKIGYDVAHDLIS